LAAPGRPRARRKSNQSEEGKIDSETPVYFFIFAIQSNDSLKTEMLTSYPVKIPSLLTGLRLVRVD
jgi:hypothetical protein